MMNPDDINMIPEWAVEQVMENERAVQVVIKKRREFEAQEPEAGEWIELLVSTDLDKIKNSFPELFSSQPKLINALKFLLWKNFLRGWVMGEAKWKSNILTLPGESSDRNPNHYIPETEDFL